jgi:hypothetical protein
MFVAVSGSRNVGLDDAIAKVEATLNIYKLQYGKDITFVTGACIGIDAIVAKMAYQMLFNVHVVVPSNNKYLDHEWHIWHTSYEMMPKISGYKDRNVKIIELSSELIAFPSVDEYYANGELSHSGTWMTIRLAKKKNIPIIIEMVNEK